MKKEWLETKQTKNPEGKVMLKNSKLIEGLPLCWWLRLRTSNAGGAGSIPGWATKIPHAARCDQKTRKLRPM